MMPLYKRCLAKPVEIMIGIGKCYEAHDQYAADRIISIILRSVLM